MASITTGLTNLMSIYYDKVFLDRAEEMMVYDVGAQKKAHPTNSGKTVYFNRFSPLAKATTPLTEATTPSSVDMSTTIVSATISEYGTYTKAGSLFSMTSIDENLKEHTEVMGQNAGETLDTLIAAELSANATEQRANGKAALSAIATSDTLDGAEIRKAVKTLKKNKAKKFENGLFKGIVPVSSEYDLRGDSEWLDAHRYVTPENIKNGQLGKLHGVEFYETNNEVVQTDAGASNAEVYSTFIFGKNAYGTLRLEGQPEKRIYVKQPGAQDTSNPIDMYSTVGWKSAFVAKILNSNWVIEILAGSQGD